MHAFILHLFRFALDSSKNTMTPKDSSVAETGNDELSELDIKKLNCLYHCDGCGGHLEGVDDINSLSC